MRTYLLLRLNFMLINTLMDLVNWLKAKNYTEFEHFGPKCPVYAEKSSFMGTNVEFLNCIIFSMRTYLLLRLQFMLINTYMDLFNNVKHYTIKTRLFIHKTGLFPINWTFWPKMFKFGVIYHIYLVG